MESGAGRRFAEAQLLKHGWSQGKGLGRFESGRPEAIKVKVKHGTAGIGHDMAEQFTFHWWDHVFNRVAADIKVEGTEEGAKVTRTRAEGAQEPISNRKPRKALLGKTHALYGNFVKAATLTSGEEVRDDESSDDSVSDSDDEDSKLDLSSTTRMTDEQLFKACGGRTAHKGARHGLTMSAKLARLEQQEREFLSRWGAGAGAGAARANPESPRPAGVAVAMAAAASTCGAKLKRSKKTKKSKRERTADNDDAGADEPAVDVEEAEQGDSANAQSRPKKNKKSKPAVERLETFADRRVVRDESETSVSVARGAVERGDAKRRKKGERSRAEVRPESCATHAADGENELTTSDGVGGESCRNSGQEEDIDTSESKKSKKKKKKLRKGERQCVETSHPGSPGRERNGCETKRSLEESSVAQIDELSVKTAKKRERKMR